MTSLAYERHGAGTPIVFLHGLTFDRTSWRPIIERIDADCIAVDLPAHGESAGPPADLEVVAAQVHELVERLGVDRPVVVGHSISGGLAALYASAYPARGAVSVDGVFDIRPFAALVKQLVPALRGPAFDEAFAVFQRSMRLDLLPEPVAQDIRQDVVLGYWDEVIRSDPDELQRRIEAGMRALDVPGLALFAEPLTSEQRAYLRARVPRLELEVWPGSGHMLHLVEADRFAARLRSFVASVTAVGGALERDALEHVGDGLAGVDR
jgi:pimeloyl-ACP methyl ester carboxylesterase